MSRVLIVSSDGHAAPPLADYRPYLEQRYLADFDALLDAKDARLTVNFFEIVDPKVSGPYRESIYDTGIIDAKWDIDRRLSELAQHGIVAEVLFPDGAPFGAGGIGSARSRYSHELELAGAHAYNRWVMDFVSGHEGHFAAQAIITFHDLDQAVRDVYWAKENGLRGLVVPGMDEGVPLFWDPVYEPFWAACEETRLPLNFHGGIGQPDYGGTTITGVPFEVRMRVSTLEARWFGHRPLWFLIWSGVLERHPDMKLVFTESHSDWAAEVIAKMDHSYDHSMFDDAIKQVVPRRPSEYWQRQCFIGASLLARGEAINHEQIGTQNMMFGADFPHPEGTWHGTLRYLQATFGTGGVDARATRAILGENAARVFGFDVDYLEPFIETTGFTIDDVLTPLAAELESDFDRNDVIRPTMSIYHAHRAAYQAAPAVQHQESTL
jgi:predicted TIM-barrel fold metal-dependent hydrolase